MRWLLTGLTGFVARPLDPYDKIAHSVKEFMLKYVIVQM